MSLLDRVQRQQQDAAAPPAGPPSSTIPRPTPVAPPRPTTPAGPATPEPAPARSSSPLLARTGMQRAALGRPSAIQQQYQTLRAVIHQRLVEEMVDSENSSQEAVIAKLSELVTEVAAEHALSLTRQDKQRLVEALTNDVLGLGPLEGLLADPDITEVMVNGPKQIYVERRGKILRSPVTFESNEQLMQVIDRIVSSIGRRVDESSPMVDARLKDGSRVNVIIPPLALKGPTVTIRKFSKDPLQVEDLIRFGSTTREMMDFVRACVAGRLNVVVSGGTGSGKTTTLNILSSFIPDDERIVTIEDAKELQLHQEHVLALEARPPNIEGRGEITIRDLVRNTLRMRPDRIVVGECRGGEALDMLQAMNTGVEGSMSTVHANTPRDAFSRLETMVMMADLEIPARVILQQLASAIKLVVQVSRLQDGTRKILSISEVLGVREDRIDLQEIFTFERVGVNDAGKVQGRLHATGVAPRILERLRVSGIQLPSRVFEESVSVNL